MNPPEQSLVVREEDLRAVLLPLLLERVFHVTSRARLQGITAAGFINSNRDGSLGNTYPQSTIGLGRHRGWVCLFDLRDQPEDALQWGLDCFYFLAPKPFGDDLAFLVVGQSAYPRLVLGRDIASPFGEENTYRIPDVESWFPADLPLSEVELVLLVHIIRRDRRPIRNSLGGAV